MTANEQFFIICFILASLAFLPWACVNVYDRFKTIDRNDTWPSRIRDIIIMTLRRIRRRCECCGSWSGKVAQCSSCWFLIQMLKEPFNIERDCVEAKRPEEKTRDDIIFQQIMNGNYKFPGDK